MGKFSGKMWMIACAVLLTANVSSVHCGFIEDARKVFDATANNILNQLRGNVNVTVKHARKVIGEWNLRKAAHLTNVRDTLTKKMQMVSDEYQLYTEEHAGIDFAPCKRLIDDLSKQSSEIVSDVASCGSNKLQSTSKHATELEANGNVVLDRLTRLKEKFNDCTRRFVLSAAVCVVYINARAFLPITTKLTTTLAEAVALTYDLTTLGVVVDKCLSQSTIAADFTKHADQVLVFAENCVDERVR